MLDTAYKAVAILTNSLADQGFAAFHLGLAGC